MPSRTNRLVALVLIGALVVSGIGFLSWTVLFHGSPAVQSRMTSWELVSDHEARAVVTVSREEQVVDATCRVTAVAEDHTVVGEATFTVTDGPLQSTVAVSIRTERRPTAIVLDGCTAPGQTRPR
jgi:type 1 fimbria pilin